jgi:hypothetical protein
MHANLLTVEAAMEDTFRVRSARLKEFGSGGIIPPAISEGVRYYFIPRNAFPRQVHPILSTLLLGVSRALRRHHRIKSPASIMALDDQACRKPACTDLCRALFCINNEEGYPLMCTQEYTRSTLRRPGCSRKEKLTRGSLEFGAPGDEQTGTAWPPLM